MQPHAEISVLEPFEALVGSWTTESIRQMYPSTVVRGRSTFEWLEGKRFLIQRSVTDHPDFPDAMAVFGVTDEQLSMHYFDSRGAYRVYAVSFTKGTWRFWRDAPGFSQRFTGTVSDDGNTITGLCGAVARRLELGRRPRDHSSKSCVEACVLFSPCDETR
jgi:hypothetical protein